MSADEVNEVLDDAQSTLRLTGLNATARLLVLVVIELRKIYNALREMQDKGAK